MRPETMLFEGWSRPGFVRKDVRMLGDPSARDAEFTQPVSREKAEAAE
jgi:hypothetical protein